MIRIIETDMNALPNVNINAGTTTRKVDDAVGVPQRREQSEKICWFVAIVNNKAERQCAKRLEKLGYECYVPTQTEVRKWRTGVRNIVERIILPSIVFIHTTERERKQSVAYLSYIKRFMTDRAGAIDAYGKHPVAIIPQDQIDMLRFVLGNADSEVTVEPPPLQLGNKVRVFRGNLTGLEGYVDKMEASNPKIYIRLNCLGCACVEVDRLSLELIK